MLVGELKLGTEESMELLVDNVSAINLAKHSVAHGRSKHIKRKFNFLREKYMKVGAEILQDRVAIS